MIDEGDRWNISEILADSSAYISGFEIDSNAKSLKYETIRERLLDFFSNDVDLDNGQIRWKHIELKINNPEKDKPFRKINPERVWF